MRVVTEGRLGPDTSSEFRQCLRDARGQLLRRGETCGSAIHLSRLRAVPWTRHCLDCQSQEEGRP
jgi:RNA polymerase-binding transcription factor DksA